ncbi:MAG: hypothetical protein P8Y40_02950 [Desulfobacterales bacterium]
MEARQTCFVPWSSGQSLRNCSGRVLDKGVIAFLFLAFENTRFADVLCALSLSGAGQGLVIFPLNSGFFMPSGVHLGKSKIASSGTF